MNYTAQNDISQTCRTFSLKINKLPTFSEINQVFQCLTVVFIWSDVFTYRVSTSHYVLTCPNIQTKTMSCTTSSKSLNDNNININFAYLSQIKACS